MIRISGTTELNRRLELILDGPFEGNPFMEVELSATFTAPDGTAIRVGGFYDGEGRYLIRLLPEQSGEWSVVTRSTLPYLDGASARFRVEPGSAPGMVRVADTFHFRHADGSQFAPTGTTVYAWVHQPDELQERTLDQLRRAPFNKLRFCVFPKSYLYNTDEPRQFPFPRNPDGTWDTTRFDVDFFRNLDRRIDDLAEAGIEADLILFHSYDRWGFAHLGAAADDRLVRYLARRLSAHPNLWWSMANEFDLVAGKTTEDWERLATVLKENDHASHLLSIHNGARFYDNTRSWITHASVQRIDLYRTSENTDAWRTEWSKPVVLDECGYEGDLDQGWGNLSAEELTRRAWEGAVRGGYVQHGETFYSDDEIIWWSKGGLLKGDSPQRLEFLARIREEAPRRVLDPLESDWDAPWGGDAATYIVIYLGAGRSRFRTVSAPPEAEYWVDVIDTWNMTIERFPDPRRDTFTIDLPGRAFMAIRLIAVAEGAA